MGVCASQADSSAAALASVPKDSTTNNPPKPSNNSSHNPTATHDALPPNSPKLVALQSASGAASGVATAQGNAQKWQNFFQSFSFGQPLSQVPCQEVLSHAREALSFLGGAPVVGSAAFAIRVLLDTAVGVAERVVAYSDRKQWLDEFQRLLSKEIAFHCKAWPYFDATKEQDALSEITRAANDAQNLLQQVSKRQEDGGMWAFFKSKSDVENLTASLERVREATVRCLPLMVAQTAEKLAMTQHAVTQLQQETSKLQQDSAQINFDVQALTKRVDLLEDKVLEHDAKVLQHDKRFADLEEKIVQGHKESPEELISNPALKAILANDMQKLEKRYLVGTRRKYAQVFQTWLKLNGNNGKDKQDKDAASQSPDSRLLWIRGGPGVGKSVIAAMLMREFKRNIVGLHFCHHDIQDCRSPGALIKSLASQLAERHAEYRSKLFAALSSISKEKINEMDVKTLFNLLLLQPLTGLSAPAELAASAEKAVLFIDALDECDQDSSSSGSGGGSNNPFVSLFANEIFELPSWLCVAITSRPEMRLSVQLKRFHPQELACSDQDNLEDVNKYLEAKLPSLLQDGVSLESAVKAMSDKVKGLFVHVQYLLSDVDAKSLTLEDIESMAGSLEDYYYEVMSRALQGNKHRKPMDVSLMKKVLSVIFAAQEPLTVRHLQEVVQSEDLLLSVVSPLSTLLQVQASANIASNKAKTKPDPDDSVVTVFHKSVRDWFTDVNKLKDKLDKSERAPFIVEEREGHVLLCQTAMHKLYAPKMAQLQDPLSSYRSAPFLTSGMAAAGPSSSSGQRSLTVRKQSSMLVSHGAESELPIPPRVALEQVLLELAPSSSSSSSASALLRYSVRYALLHACMAVDVASIWALVCSLPYMELRLREGQGHKLLGEYINLAMPRIPGVGGLRVEMEHFQRFLQLQAPQLSERPLLVYASALAFPDSTGVHRQAASLQSWWQHRLSRERRAEDRVWMEWINKPQQLDPCLLTLKGDELGAVLFITLTHDDRRIILQDGRRNLRCYDVDTGELQWSRTTQTWSCSSHISLSSDDSLIALSYGNSLRRMRPAVIMDTMSGDTVYSWPDGVIQASLYPDGNRVAMWRVWNGAKGMTVNLQLLDTHSGSVLYTLEQHPFLRTHFEHGVDDDVFSPHRYRVEVSMDGLYVISCAASEPAMVRIWSASDGSLVHELSHVGVGDIVTWRYQPISLDGSVTLPSPSSLSSSGGSEYRLVVVTGTEPKTEVNYKGSFDYHSLHYVHVWDVRSGHREEHHGPITSFASFVPGTLYTGPVYHLCIDGMSVAVGYGSPGVVRVFDMRSGQLQATLRGHTSPVLTLHSLVDGRMVSGADDGSARIWQPSSIDMTSIEGHTAAANTICLSPHEDKLLVGSLDGTCRLWDVRSGQHLVRLQGPSDDASCAFFSPDGNRIAACMGKPASNWQMSDASTGTMLFSSADTAGPHGNHTNDIIRMVFLSTGATMVSISWDGTARVWDAVSGVATHVLHHAGHPQLGRCALSPDDKELWIGDRTGVVHVWDLAAVMSFSASTAASAVPVATLNLISSSSESKDDIRGMSMSRDGNLVCVCFSEQGTAYVLHRERREVLHTFSFPRCFLSGAAAFFGPSNRYLLIGDFQNSTAGGVLHVKDLSQGSATQDVDVASITFPISLLHVLVSSDGRRIIIDSDSGVYVLDLGDDGVAALPSCVSIGAMSVRSSPTMISILQLHSL